jgi:glyoxylase-like metal-dependent hydrolase (beta-lactamase superfamily II)
MFFRQRLAQDATLSYLFGCGSCHVGIAIDPVLGDEQWFIDEAARQDVKITHVIDTHVHADHFSGGRKLAGLSGAQYCLHESNRRRVAYPFEPLQDGQRIEVGNVFVDVLHTPGHTPDSICLLVTDRRRTPNAENAAPWFVLTGDTLFVGSAGRPDLAGREAEMAEQIYTSVHQKLLTLPAEVELYPGHTSGSTCGAGMSGKPASTIGYEKRWNPMLALDRAGFVAALTETIPPRPAEMDRMVQANLA